jgi:hypothetical protein
VPSLSAIIPLERGSQSPVAALDGFLRQSIGVPQIEVVLIVDAGVRVSLPSRLSRLTIRKVRWPRGRMRAGAINAGARAARSPVLLVLDPKWRPLPSCAAYCIAFHEQQPAIADVVIPATSLDAAHANDPLIWWLDQQQMAGLSPAAPGIHNWHALRFDALSMKRALPRKWPMPAGEGDDWLIKARWVAAAPLRVFTEQVPVVTTAGVPAIDAVMDAEYRAAYARLKAMRASSQTFAAEPVDDRFQHPEKYVLSDADRHELRQAIVALAAELAGRNPRFAVGDEAERFATLGKLYLVAISHARSAGWLAAKGRR